MTAIDIQIRATAALQALEKTRAELQSLQGQAARTGTTLSGIDVGGAASVWTSRLASLRAGLGTVAMAAVPVALTLAGVAAAAAAGVKSGIAYNATLEQQTIAFRTLLGSMEAAQARMRDLAEFAGTTPFELPEVVNASRILQSLAGESLAAGDGLRLIGDAAAAAGRSFEETAMWVGRLYGGLRSGTAVGEATLRLLEMGLISGETAKQLNQLAESGQAMTRPFEAIQETFGRFAGAMALQGETFRGLTSTLKDTVMSDLGKMTESLTTQLKNLVRGILEARGVIGSRQEVLREQLDGQLGTYRQRLGTADLWTLGGVQRAIAEERARQMTSVESEDAYLTALRPFVLGRDNNVNYKQLKAAVDAAQGAIPEDRRLPLRPSVAAYQDRFRQLQEQIRYAREIAALEEQSLSSTVRMAAEARSVVAQSQTRTVEEQKRSVALQDQVEAARMANDERIRRTLPLEEQLLKLAVREAALKDQAAALAATPVSVANSAEQLELRRLQVEGQLLEVREQMADVEGVMSRQADEQIAAARQVAAAELQRLEAKAEALALAERELEIERQRSLSLDMQRIQSDWRLTEAQRRSALLSRGAAGVADGSLSSDEFGAMRNQLGPDPHSTMEQLQAQLVAFQDAVGTLEQNLASLAMSPIMGLFEGLQTSIEGLIRGTMTWRDALANVGLTVLNEVIGAFSRMLAAWIVNMTVMRALQGVFAATTNVQAATAAAAWAPAAVAASIATFGAASGIGMAAYLSSLATGTTLTAAAAVPRFAVGGVTPGVPTLAMVGERGPELVVPADVTARLTPDQRSSLVSGNLAAAATPAGGRSLRQEILVYMDKDAWLEAARDRIGAIAIDAMRREVRTVGV